MTRPRWRRIAGHRQRPAGTGCSGWPAPRTRPAAFGVVRRLPTCGTATISSFVTRRSRSPVPPKLDRNRLGPIVGPVRPIWRTRAIPTNTWSWSRRSGLKWSIAEPRPTNRSTKTPWSPWPADRSSWTCWRGACAAGPGLGFLPWGSDLKGWLEKRVGLFPRTDWWFPCDRLCAVVARNVWSRPAPLESRT